MEWTDPTISQTAKERATKMFGLVPRFTTRMHKRAADAQEGSTSDLKIPGDKRPRPSRSEEEVPAYPEVITMDSL